MSLFHLYAAVRHRAGADAAPGPRRLRAAARVPAVPGRQALPQPADVVGRRLRGCVGVATIAYLLAGGDDFWDRNTLPEPVGHRSSASRSCVLVLEAVRRTSGWIMPFVIALVPRLRVRRARGCRGRGRTAATTSPRLVGLHVHDARGHLRHGGRRVVVADHPVHDLRRLPAVLGRRQVLHRLLLRRDGRQAHRRRPHRGAGVVPAGRAVGLGRRDHGDDRLGRLPDAGEGRLRQERRRRPARGRRPGRDHLAAGAGRGGVPDRRVPEDLLPRRAADGDDPDAPLLPVAVPDGRARRAQVRHARRDVPTSRSSCGR